MKDFDPLIRREYKRLGMNIVPDEDLADLIFARVQHERLRNIAFGAIVVAAIIVGLFFGWRLTDSSTSTGNSATNTSTLSFNQEGVPEGILPLPQAGYMDINGANPSTSQASFLFQLTEGWVIQSVTDNPDPIMGEAGTVKVFRVEDGAETLVQQYMMSSRTQILEFGVNMTGIYRYQFSFNNSNFKGRVRIAFVRSQ
jgi:hypothetical protein